MESELSVHIYVIICNIENNIRICCSIDLKCYYDYFYRLVRLVLKGCFFMEYCICICLVLFDHRCKSICSYEMTLGIILTLVMLFY